MPAPPLIVVNQNPYPVGIAYGVTLLLEDGQLSQPTLVQAVPRSALFAIRDRLVEHLRLGLRGPAAAVR